MDLAVLYGLFRRLSGAPLDSQGRPLLTDGGAPRNVEGSWGLRLPMRKKGVVGTSKQIPDTTAPAAIREWSAGYEQNSYVQVPVFVEGTDNREFGKVFPCVTINYSALMDPEDGARVYNESRGDEIGESRGVITTEDGYTGETVEQPDAYYTRRHPDAFRMEVTVSLYSRDPIEMMLLDRALLIAMPYRGSLLVDLADGTTARRDMMWRRYANMDRGEPFDPAVGVGAERDSYHRRAHTYEIETVVDNSVHGFGALDFRTTYTVLERILELQDLTGRLQHWNLQLENRTT